MARSHLTALNKYLGLVDGRRPSRSQNLSVPQKQVLLLHLEGVPSTQIADETGYSIGWIQSLLRSDKARSVAKEYMSFIDTEFQALYKMSVSAIRDALSPKEDIDIRLKASEKFLKAHGKYGNQGVEVDTAEDIIKRFMEFDSDGKPTKIIEERIKKTSAPARCDNSDVHSCDKDEVSLNSNVEAAN